MTALLTERPIELGADPIEQIYITHCLFGEGPYQHAGFNVRASSTSEALWHRFALEYPHYELPAGMAVPLSASETPRRLALLRIPGGSSALIHSVFVPAENRGRTNNFFSHVLVAVGLRPDEALATWGSPDWATQCKQDDGAALPRLRELPVTGLLSDAAVTAFLQKDYPADEANLATVVFPRRLAADAIRRRELLRLALHGCQRALGASSTARGSRFYILAEPGLTALLLYAAARLLPAALVARLTFSTYEPACRKLASYKHARIVGTYCADRRDHLEKDFFMSLGCALDTFRHEFSAELGHEDATELDEWIDLAAAGDWDTIDKIHNLLGKKIPDMVSVRDAKQAFRLSARMKAGEVGPEELVAARQAAWGRPILEKHRDDIWPVIRDGCLTDPRLCEEFAELLNEHVPELEKRAARALQRQEPCWRASLQLLRCALKQDPVKVWKAFERIIPEPPLPAELRVSLLLEMQGLQPVRPPQNHCWQHLLKNCTRDDLEALAGSSLDRRWFARALCYALLDGQTSAAATGYIHSGDDALVRVFWKQFKLIKREAQRRTILAPLFLRSDDGRSFLSRSLKLSMRIRPDTLGWLLDSLGACGKEWLAFWCSENHLARLLKLLWGLGEEAAPIWERLCRPIDHLALVPGDAGQRALLMELAAARERPGSGIPARAAELIGDWNILRAQFEKASAVPETERRKAITACNRLAIDPVDLLAKYFQHFIVPRGLEKETVDDFLGFFHSYCPSGEDYLTYGCRLLWWLRIVENCPEEASRAFYERYYVEHFVPVEFRWRLARETCQAGKLLASVFESLPNPTESGQTALVAGGVQKASSGFLERQPNARRRHPARKLLLGLATHAASGIAAVLLYVLLTRWFSG